MRSHWHTKYKCQVHLWHVLLLIHVYLNVAMSSSIQILMYAIQNNSNVTWDLHYIWDDYLQNDKNKVPSGSICHKWVCRIGWKLEPGLADIEIELGSEMSAEWSVMSDVSESVVCMSFELSFRGMKPYMCGRGWEISALAPLLGTSCSGLPSSKLLDEILLCARGWAMIRSGVLGPVWNLFGGLR